MKIGFTGTREGLTDAQRRALCRWVTALDRITEAHHGSCEGADDEFHQLMRWLKVPIFLHPPEDLRASLFQRHVLNVSPGNISKPKPFLERNHDIVDAVAFMIVCPKEPEEILRSGTWATYRYAGKKDVPVALFEP